MSLENVDRFLSEVKRDPELSERLKSARDPKHFVERALAIGQERGIPFTQQDLEARFQAGSGELSEDQLDGVSGGTVLSDAVELAKLIQLQQQIQSVVGTATYATGTTPK